MKPTHRPLRMSLTLLLCLRASVAWAADYTVSPSTNTVDGRDFCGGSPCTSSDTITIMGGERGDLLIRYFDGNGSYITIQNEEINQVVITHDGAPGYGILSLESCKYIDVRGDRNPDHTYGIKVINDGTPDTPAKNVWIYGESDHIKLGYIETYHTGSASGYASVGIGVGDGNLTASWTFDTFEIHHDYVHDTRYSGMYLGHNQPSIDDNPYLADFSIHDNLLEDLGSYGFTFKGVRDGSTNNAIYNNVVRPSNRASGSSTGLVMDESQCEGHNTPYFGCTGVGEGDLSTAKKGFGVQFFYGTASVDIHDNWVEKTKGPGIVVAQSYVDLHGNTILGCGTQNSERYAQGVFLKEWNSVETGSPVMHVFDNVIVEPVRYGISDLSGNEPTALLERNVIVEAGLGEFENEGGLITEGSGLNANVYDTDADHICFAAWSDDADYSNDDFTLTCSYPYTGGGGGGSAGAPDSGPGGTSTAGGTSSAGSSGSAGFSTSAGGSNADLGDHQADGCDCSAQRQGPTPWLSLVVGLLQHSRRAAPAIP